MPKHYLRRGPPSRVPRLSNLSDRDAACVTSAVAFDARGSKIRVVFSVPTIVWSVLRSSDGALAILQPRRVKFAVPHLLDPRR